METQLLETAASVLIVLPEEIQTVTQAVKNKTGAQYPGNENTPAHITLYNAKFDQAKYPELVKELASLKGPLTLKIGTLQTSLSKKNKGLFVSFTIENAAALKELQEKIISLANPLRQGLVRQKDLDRRDAGIFDDQEFAAIQETGYQYTGKYFNPHITIGEISPADSDKLEILKEDLRQLEGKEFEVENLSVEYTVYALPEYRRVSNSEFTALPL